MAESCACLAAAKADSIATNHSEGNPLVLKEAEGGGVGGLLHVLWVDRDLMIPFRQVNLGEDHAAGRLSGKSACWAEGRHLALSLG